MYRLAIKMLFGDKAKCLLLLSALALSSFLMTQQGSVFLGLIRWTTSTIRNVDVPIWVVDPFVEQANEIIELRDTDLVQVRSVPGVAWAVPLYFSIQQARVDGGAFHAIQLMGLDSATFIGAPARILEGRLEDLWQSGAVMIDEIAQDRFSQGGGPRLQIGDFLTINDHEARIVAICRTERSFFNSPYVYTTYERAIEFSPKKRKSLGYILAAPQQELPVEQVVKAINEKTSLHAYTEKDFFWATIWWIIRNSGIPISFGTTISMGFIVGVAVAGQTFYSFIVENLRYFGALKAMGASTWLLCKMVLCQALVIGLIGYGIGMGMTAIFGFSVMAGQKLPFFMPIQVPLLTLGSILLICSISSLIAIGQIRELEAAEVFRG